MVNDEVAISAIVSELNFILADEGSRQNKSRLQSTQSEYCWRQVEADTGKSKHNNNVLDFPAVCRTTFGRESEQNPLWKFSSCRNVQNSKNNETLRFIRQIFYLVFPRSPTKCKARKWIGLLKRILGFLSLSVIGAHIRTRPLFPTLLRNMIYSPLHYSTL